MTSALVQFFYLTGGLTYWEREVADTWLVGDPCENGWYGVTCCLDTYPEFGTDRFCHPAGYQQTGNTSRVLPFNYNHDLGRTQDGTSSAANGPSRNGASENDRRRLRRLSSNLASLANLGDRGDPSDLRNLRDLNIDFLTHLEALWSRPLDEVDHSIQASSVWLGRRRAQAANDVGSANGEASIVEGDASEVGTPSTPIGSGVFPNGCRANNGEGGQLATGTSADTSRCRIVRIDLPAKGLRGVLSTIANDTHVADTVQALWAKQEWVTNARVPGLSNVLCWPRGKAGNASELEWLQVLNIPENDLHGLLPDDIYDGEGVGADDAIPFDACLPRLRVFNVQDNQFQGLLPTFPKLVRLTYVGLGSGRVNLYGAVKGNRFHYPSNRLSDANRQVLGEYELMFRNCEQQGDKCSGVPPRSCDAFGGNETIYVPKQTTKGRLHCQECPKDFLRTLIIVMVGLFVVSVGVVSAYAWLISRGKAETTKMWIASFSIVWYAPPFLSARVPCTLNHGAVGAGICVRLWR